MATGSILLVPQAAATPDGGTDKVPPGIVPYQSTATAPAPLDFEAVFDASTEQWLCWAFPCPADFSSGTAPVAEITWRTSATTGNVIWVVQIAATADNEDGAAKAYSTANSGTFAANATANRIEISSLTLTNRDSMNAGEWINVRLARDADNASDTAAATARFRGLRFAYTTA